MSKTDNNNSPFICSTAPCPASFSMSRLTCCYEPHVSQQTVRETNPFTSGVENEHIPDSGIDTQCYTQSTPANFNYSHSMCTDLTAKQTFQGTPILNHQPCKHDVCAAQHIRKDEGNTVYSSVDECCFPGFTRSSQRVRKPCRTFCDLSSDSGAECNDHSSQCNDHRSHKRNPGPVVGNMST